MFKKKKNLPKEKPEHNDHPISNKTMVPKHNILPKEFYMGWKHKVNLEHQKSRKPKTTGMCLNDSGNKLKNFLLTKFGRMQDNLNIKNTVIDGSGEIV